MAALAAESHSETMPHAITQIRDCWLPRQLPTQLAALGGLYRDALEAHGAGEDRAAVGWRLHALLAFASRLAPLDQLAHLTGLTVEQVDAVLGEFAGDGVPLIEAA